MKNIITIVLMAAVTAVIHGQTMQWVSMPAGTVLDKCFSTASKKDNQHCYALQYTPAVSGTLTSYTTGFLVSCTSMGSAIQKNESCSMANKVNLIDGCAESGQTLMNSSGNTGSVINNKLVAGKPVYLHQVCFSIPGGENITVREDEVTDLTTSIDLGNGQVVSESPIFITQVIGKSKADVALPTAFLDFKARSAEHLVSRLDWTVRHGIDEVAYDIEHGVDGNSFTKVGEFKASEGSDIIKSYSFLHQEAIEGYNFYRLKVYDVKGSFTYSPIRVVNFSGDAFSMKAWPSPVSDVLNVYVGHAKEKGNMVLMDISGRIVSDVAFADGNSENEIQVSGITAGLYTLVVQSGQHMQEQKIIIVE